MCPTSFYHLAMDVSIKADMNPNYFSVATAATTASSVAAAAAGQRSPAFTEPNWSGDVGVVVYPLASSNLESAITAVGVFSAVLSIVVVKKIQMFLIGIKAL